jgi:hypothetical protein
MKNELIYKAIEKLKENTGFIIDFEFKEKLNDNKTNENLTLFFNNRKTHWVIERKKEIREHQLMRIFNLKIMHENLLVLAEYIPPKIRKLLLDKDIAYIDLVCNTYLKYGELFIFIEGNKRMQPMKSNKGRAFTKTGLKIIFAMLIHPELINTTYRDIANTTGIALDTIHKTLNGLKQLGYIIYIDKKRKKIIRINELFNKWIPEYDTNLRPKLYIGKFKLLKPDEYDNWQNIQLTNTTQWGGEPAAYLLTKYLNPEIFTLYTAEKTMDLIKTYRLVPDEEGNIEIYQKFWRNNKGNGHIVPAELVYADLINTGDPRNLETAKLVYDELLKDRYQ